MNIGPVQFVRAIDGDTIVVIIPELPAIFGFNVSVRLKGIQCPELRSPDPGEKSRAIRAKAFTERWCQASDYLSLVNVQRGKYFRLVADLWNGKEFLNSVLLQEQQAVKVKKK